MGVFGWGAKKLKTAAADGKAGLMDSLKIILGVLILPLVGVAAWMLSKPKGAAGGDGLYQMGYLLMDAPPDRAMDASYLAGRMKRMREDSKNDLLKGQGSALGGLKLESVNANFGKVREYSGGGYNAGNFRKFER